MRISAELANRIRQDAIVRTPQEACGFVVWMVERDEIVSLRPAANVSWRPRHRFEISQRRLIEETLRPLPRGAVLGIYHSHVATAAVPSENDCERAGYWRTVPYLIYSLRAGELAAWFLNGADSKPERVSLEIT